MNRRTMWRWRLYGAGATVGAALIGYGFARLIGI